MWIRSREGSDAFGDLDRLDGALDLAGSAEYAVSFTDWVCFPAIEQRLAAIIRCLLVDLVLFSWNVVFFENIDWADRYADAVSYAEVEVHPDCNAVHTVFLANAIFPFHFVSFMFFLLCPFVGKRGIIDYSSFRHRIHQTKSGEDSMH